MPDFPECERFAGRLRSICRNEAVGVPLNGRNSVNAYRESFGFHKLNEQDAKPILIGDKKVTVTFGEKLPQPSIVPLSGGPGTELKAILSECGITPSYGCNCNDKAIQMDRWGVDGCREHYREIVDWLTESASSASWWSKIKVAASGYLSVDSLIDEAIRRSEEKLLLGN